MAGVAMRQLLQLMGIRCLGPKLNTRHLARLAVASIAAG